MKPFIIPTILTLTFSSAHALTTGDIAFTGFNADGVDNLAFVALAPIPNGTEIHFTDNEWTGAAFNTGESGFTWTATSAIAEGAIVLIDDVSGTATSNLGTVVYFESANKGIAGSDEIVYAYVGTPSTPTAFLSAIANSGFTANGANLTNTSLADGTTAINLGNIDGGADIGTYTGVRAGQVTFAAYAALVNNTANWITQDGSGDQSADSTAPDVPFETTAFTTGGPVPVTVEVSSEAISEGDSGTTPLTFTVTRSEATTAFSVDFAITSGTASSGSDYAAFSGTTLNFAVSGPLSQIVTIDVTGDTTIEADETVTGGLTNLVNTTGTTTFATATANGTILNDDTVPVLYPPNGKSTFSVVGTISERSPTVPLAGAEIPAFHPTSKRAFLSSNAGIEIIDLTDPTAPAYIGIIDLVGLGLPSNDVSSITVHGDVLAACTIASPKTAPGTVAFLDAATGALLGSATVGSNPDHVAFTPDGLKVLTADEGELVGDPAADTTPGTVSIIDVSAGFATPPVTLVGFASFNAQAAALGAAGVRIFSGGTPEFDFEPEYLAFSADGSEAMVVLQEANAVAILDIATATFTSVVPLGEKDYSGLLADFSDRDGAGASNLINPTTGNPVFGLYMPDQIASFESGGQTYYITANEGDDRDDFLTTAETIRAGSGSYDLDNTTFANEAALKTNAALGRLTVSNAPGLRGDSNNDTDIDRILAYGARSFSILDDTGAIVYDSGDMIETIVASLFPASFDDGRSDNKGPEPEGVTTAVIGCCTYAFVGLERSDMVLVFDITNPLSPTYVAGLDNIGDAPEGLVAVSSADSPSGKPLLLVASEGDATLSVIELTGSKQFALQILHASDLEGGVDAVENAPGFAAIVEALENDAATRSVGSILLSAGDNYIPGPFYNAAGDLAAFRTSGIFNDTYNTLFGVTTYNSLREGEGRVDISIMNILGFDAAALGNHEFDNSSAGLELIIEEDFRSPNGPASDRWVGAQFPYLSANLDFSADPFLSDLHTASILPNTAFASGPSQTDTGNGNIPKIAPATTILVDGERVGVVGATTQLLSSISSPSGTVGTAGTVNDMPALAAVLQPVIDDLMDGDNDIAGDSDDVDKIILVSHLQQIALEQALAPLLSGVDVIIAGGSDTLLADSTDHLRAGDTAAGGYPFLASNLDAEPVAIVSTDGEYSYVGRLVVCFDENGVLLPASIDEQVSGVFASDATGVTTTTGQPTVAAAIAASTKATEVEKLTAAVTGVIIAKDGDIKGYTDVYIEGRRGIVRTEEATMGDVTADANLRAASLAGSAASVSIKNGGGLRASVGEIDGTNGDLLPPQPNPLASKPLGAVSQLDLENVMRFNNRLMVFETTPAGLKALLEHGVAATAPGATPGQFAQIGGARFSFDTALAPGSRVLSVAVVDENDDLVDCVVENGAILGDPARVIGMVTLNFLAQGGDNYPFKANGDNFRFILDDYSLSAVIPETDNFTSSAIVPANAMGEQQATADWFGANHPTPVLAYDTLETPVANDLRIQQIEFRTDTVLDGPALFQAWLAKNGYTSGGFGTDSDNNGVNDEVEFFFNQSTNDPSDLGNLPVVTQANGDKLLTFTTNASAAGVSGVLEVSDDLGVTDAWETAIETSDFEVVTTSTVGGETTTTLRLLGPAVRKFWRYRVNGN